MALREIMHEEENMCSPRLTALEKEKAPARTDLTYTAGHRSKCLEEDVMLENIKDPKTKHPSKDSWTFS